MNNNQLVIRISNKIFYDGNVDRKDAFVYYTLLLSLCMIFNLNQYLDLILLIGFCCLFACFYKRNFFIFTYVALIFFESKLAIPFLHASLLRVALLFYMARLLYNSQIAIELKECKYTMAFILIYVLMIIFDIGTIRIFDNLSMFSKLFCIGMIAFECYNYYGNEKEKAKNMLLLIIAVFAMFCGIYGLYNGKILDYGSYNRYCGTIDDPNMSAMLYCLGIVSLYGVKNVKKSFKILIFLGLVFDLFLTVSLSGIAIFLIISIMYLLVKRPIYAIVLLILGTIAGAIFLNIPLNGIAQLHGLQLRIKSIIEGLLSGDFSTITSGRTDIASKYIAEFNKLPISYQLLGGNNTVEVGPFRDKMVEMIGNVTHNSYIDMLFMHGYLGTIIIVGFILFRIVFLIKQYFKYGIDNVVFAMQKLTILLFSATLTIFPFRYYIFFMLI